MNNLYGDIIEIDEHRNPVYPDVVIAYRSGSKIGVLQNVNALVNSNHLMEAPELSFDVHKETDGTVCDLWDDVKDFRLIYVPALDSSDFNPWYELHVTIDENNETIKHCECFHIQETELSQLSLHDIEINTEDDIARPDYVQTKIYDENNPEASLLDRLLKDKASHYSIHHVDGSIAMLQRQFSWKDSDIKGAFDDIAEEVECLFIYGLSTLDDGKIHRTISLYDLNDVCLDCGERGSFSDGVCTKCGSTNIKPGYGENSGIFINKDNFTSEISYESNADDVKNCFRLEPGDDVMTAAVRNVNPARSQYVWYFSDSLKNDMSPSLRSAIEAYDAAFAAYEDTETMSIPEGVVTSYNSLITKYSPIKTDLEPISYPIIGFKNLTDFYYKAVSLNSYLKTSLFPTAPPSENTTAEAEAAKLTSSVLSPMGIQNAEIASASTVNSAVINYSKVFFNSSACSVKVKSSSYNATTHVWTGVLTLTMYADSNDTADTEQITIQVTGATIDYLKTLLEKTMKKDGKDATGTVALFELNDSAFASALSLYSQDNLAMLSAIARSCLDVLIEQGCATEGSSIYGDTYTSIYLPYYNKSTLIELELAEREGEVNITNNALEAIEEERKRIGAILDLRTYLGEELWVEFCSFRRDDEYSNNNYISDSLSDEKIVENAQEFLKRAQRDLVKAATLQHTITCSLNNLLLFNEDDTTVDDGEMIYINGHSYTINKDSVFSPLLSRFKVGNWLRIEIDGKIFKLRMTDYVVTYDELQTIDVEFSDVTYGLGSMSDIQDILSKSKSMATSYSTTARQAGSGQKANATITNMIENGLYLTNKKIANADNQNLLIDDTGLLMRQMGEYTDEYSPEQIKIINKGLYFTNDNWLTAKAGVGAFTYYDPYEGDYREGYGVIAEKIVGNIILGNDLGIYNESGSFIANNEGVTITAVAGETGDTGANQNVFTVQRDNGDGTATRYIYIDNQGRVRISGSSLVITAGDSTYNLMQSLSKKTTRAIMNTAGSYGLGWKKGVS